MSRGLGKNQRELVEVLSGYSDSTESYYWDVQSLVSKTGALQSSVNRSLASLIRHGYVERRKHVFERMGAINGWQYEYLLLSNKEHQQQLERDFEEEAAQRLEEAKKLGFDSVQDYAWHKFTNR